MSTPKHSSCGPIVAGVTIAYVVGSLLGVLLVGGLPSAWESYLQSLADPTSYAWWQWPWGLHGAKVAEYILHVQGAPGLLSGSISISPPPMSAIVRLTDAFFADIIILFVLPVLAAVYLSAGAVLLVKVFRRLARRHT